MLQTTNSQLLLWTCCLSTYFIISGKIPPVITVKDGTFLSVILSQNRISRQALQYRLHLNKKGKKHKAHGVALETIRQQECIRHTADPCHISLLKKRQSIYNSFDSSIHQYPIKSVPHNISAVTILATICCLAAALAHLDDVTTQHGKWLVQLDVQLKRRWWGGQHQASGVSGQMIQGSGTRKDFLTLSIWCTPDHPGEGSLCE